MPSSARRGAFFLLTSQWSQIVIQLSSVIVLSRLLPPRSFGLVAMVSAITGLAALLSEFGMSLSALIGDPPSPAERNALFWINGAMGLVVMAIFMGISPLLASFYDRPQLLEITLVLSLPYLLNALSVQFRVELSLGERWGTLAVVESAPALFTLVLSIVIAATLHTYWALVIPTTLAALLQLGLAVMLSGWRPAAPRHLRTAQRHLRFGRDTLLLQALNYMASNGDSVLIGRSLGASLLGQYNRAYTLGVLPVGQIAAPLTRLVLPRLSAVRPEHFDAALCRYQSVLIYAQLAPLSLIAATAHPLVAVLLGPAWPAVPALAQIQALGAAFSAVGYIVYWAFLVRRRTGALAISEGIFEVLMVIAMVLVVSRGAIWVAWAVAAGQLAILLSSTLLIRWILDINVVALLKASLAPVAAFVIASLVGMALARGFRHEAQVVALVISATGWILSLVMLHGLSRRLRTEVVDLFKLLRGQREPTAQPANLGTPGV